MVEPVQLDKITHLPLVYSTNSPTYRWKGTTLLFQLKYYRSTQSLLLHQYGIVAVGLWMFSLGETEDFLNENIIPECAAMFKNLSSFLIYFSVSEKEKPWYKNQDDNDLGHTFLESDLTLPVFDMKYWIIVAEPRPWQKKWI